MSKVSCEGIPSAAPMDINSALEEVLKQSLIADGLARGFRESQKRALVWTSGRTTDNDLARLSEELLDRDVDNAADKVGVDKIQNLYC